MYLACRYPHCGSRMVQLDLLLRRLGRRIFSRGKKTPSQSSSKKQGDAGNSFWLLFVHNSCFDLSAFLHLLRMVLPFQAHHGIFSDEFNSDTGCGRYVHRLVFGTGRGSSDSYEKEDSVQHSLSVRSFCVSHRPNQPVQNENRHGQMQGLLEMCECLSVWSD